LRPNSSVSSLSPTNPTARWYAQRCEEPRETTTRRVRQALAGVLFALASALVALEQRETVSA
jgi:hypothetical protein